jgi:hypothetical protein
LNDHNLKVIPFKKNISEKKKISLSDNPSYKKKNIINNEIINNHNSKNVNNINDSIINNSKKKDINDSNKININYSNKKDFNYSNSNDIDKTDINASFNEENNNSNNIKYNLENNYENSEKNRINNISYDNDKIINDNKIHNFAFTYIILITFIYIFFGHFFILINICLQNLRKNYLSFILIFLIIAYLEIPFFFYQFYANLILLNIYLYKNGFKSFILHFYDIIKMKFQNNIFHAIVYNVHCILVILIFGTFILTKKLLYKKKASIYIFMAILGILVDLLILPLHIIINPFILCYIVKTKKYDDKNNENYYKKFYNYIYTK